MSFWSEYFKRCWAYSGNFCMWWMSFTYRPSWTWQGPKMVISTSYHSIFETLLSLYTNLLSLFTTTEPFFKSMEWTIREIFVYVILCQKRLVHIVLSRYEAFVRNFQKNTCSHTNKAYLKSLISETILWMYLYSAVLSESLSYWWHPKLSFQSKGQTWQSGVLLVLKPVHLGYERQELHGLIKINICKV